MKRMNKSDGGWSKIGTDAEFSCGAGLQDWLEQLDPQAPRLSKHLLVLMHGGGCVGG